MRIPNQALGVARRGSVAVAPAQRVTPQLRNIGGGPIGGGSLEIVGYGWCDLGCAAGLAACIAGTSGLATLLCELAYIGCEKGCHPDVAIG